MRTQTDLIEWIQQHKVCWELVPYYAIGRAGKIQVGFELDLFAQFESGAKPNPGCKQCEEVFHNLAEIGRLALPTDFRPTRYDFQQFDASFHLRTETKLKPEIQLTILIIHREGFFNPVDECERKCATEIQQRLKNMGVQRKVWSQRTAV